MRARRPLSHRIWPQLVLCVPTLCLPAADALAEAVKPLAFEAVAGVRSFEIQGDLGALSHDGAWLAFAVQHGARPRLHEVVGDYTATGVQVHAYGMEIHLVNVASGETRQLTPEGASSYGPTWSPDGRSLAYYSDRDGAVRVWVWDVATDAHRRLSSAIARPFFGFEKIRWTPDGRQVLLKLLPEGTTIAQANAAVASGPAGTLDRAGIQPGATVVIRRAHAVPRPAEASPAAVITRPPAMERAFADLALVDVATGRVRRLIERGHITNYRLSPDGSRVLAIEPLGVGAGTLRSISRMVFLPISSARAVRHVDAQVVLGFGNTFAWSPDGSQVAYLDRSGRALGDLFLVSVNGGHARCLTAADQPRFNHDFRPPLWHPTGDRVYLIGEGRLWSVSVPQGGLRALTPSGDLQITGLFADATEERIWTPDGGRSTYVETWDRSTGNVGIYKVDLASGRLVQLVNEPKEYGTRFPSPPQVARNAKTVAFIAQDARHPMEVWVAGPDFANMRQLTRVNPQFDDYVFGEIRSVEWRTGQGEIAAGLLLLPAGYEPGKRYPVIARVYGGQHGTTGRNRFGVEGADFNNMQMLATRGYAVFAPDIPLRTGTPMSDIAEAVLPGLNRLIEMGIADPDRLGVFGQSHGGYTALSLLVQTNRFKAAVISAGKSNLISAYGMTSSGPGWSESGQGRMGGTPWEVRERYVENSPFFYFDRVATPLLIAHGQEDRAVPIQLAREIFVGLQRLGKEVELREYPGEEHTIASYENMIDYWQATISWFDKYIKGDAY